ncbi:hypothetical protein [Thiolapillus sp.]
MNDASAAMKEWRRAQTSQASPLAVRVPESVMHTLPAMESEAKAGRPQ